MGLSKGSVALRSTRTSSFYLHTITIVLESGALFSAFSIITLVSYLYSRAKLDSESEGTAGCVLQSAFNVNVQIALLAPLLILLRAHFGISHGYGFGEAWQAKGRSTFAASSTQVQSDVTGGEAIQLEAFKKQMDGGLKVLCEREARTVISPADEHRNISGDADSILFVGKEGQQFDSESNMSK